MTLLDVSLFPILSILKSVVPSPHADQFVAKFLQKCLKANTGYKIVNNQLKETIKKIFGLENLTLNSKQILAFSYDAFVFGLYISVKTASLILFKALIYFLGSLGELVSALITENLPILTGASWGMASAIIGNFLPISSGWFFFYSV